MDDITRLCREQTRLTMLQISLLSRMAIVFPFLADLAHGELKVYVRTKDPESFLIVAQQRPHTVYLPGKDSAVGRRSQQRLAVGAGRDHAREEQGLREVKDQVPFTMCVSDDLSVKLIECGATKSAVTHSYGKAHDIPPRCQGTIFSRSAETVGVNCTIRQHKTLMTRLSVTLSD